MAFEEGRPNILRLLGFKPRDYAITSFCYRCTRNDNLLGLEGLKPLQIALVCTP